MAWLTFDHLVRQFRELDYFRRDHLSSALDDIEANSIDPAKERLLLALLDYHERRPGYDPLFEHRIRVTATSAESIRLGIDRLMVDNRVLVRTRKPPEERP
jgi:hypothetical protein